MISLREVSMDGLCVQMTRSGQVFASFGRSLVGSDRDGVLAFAIGKRRFDLLDQLAGGLRTELDDSSVVYEHRAPAGRTRSRRLSPVRPIEDRAAPIWRRCAHRLADLEPPPAMALRRLARESIGETLLD
jgi:hypothetical protein